MSYRDGDPDRLAVVADGHRAASQVVNATRRSGAGEAITTRPVDEHRTRDPGTHRMLIDPVGHRPALYGPQKLYSRPLQWTRITPPCAPAGDLDTSSSPYPSHGTGVCRGGHA